MSIPLEVYEGGRKEVKDLQKFAKVLAKEGSVTTKKPRMLLLWPF
jgi:hypothetical protein